jgi:hypothetical protein
METEYLHFPALLPNIGESVQHVCELIRWKVLGIVIPAIYSP